MWCTWRKAPWPLVSADTSWAARSRLRCTRDRAEFGEACAKLRELLPEDGPASRALAAWVRSALIDDGAKEAEVKRLQKLGDLEQAARRGTPEDGSAFIVAKP